MRGMTMKTAKQMLFVSALGITTLLLAGGVLTLGGCATPPGSSASADSNTEKMKTFGQ